MNDKELLTSLKSNLPQMKELLSEINKEYRYEDYIYRFYHQSFKVYRLQDLTMSITKLLIQVAPDINLNPWFLQIFNEGTCKEFKLEHNKHWPEETRPIVEAFFHAKYFLEMCVKYAEELERPPEVLPSGWASVLYLYNMR
jgi:hypothetical protein